jgi:hypothetical protein
LQKALVGVTRPVETAWIAEYSLHHVGKEQDGSGACTGFMGAGMFQWVLGHFYGIYLDLSGTFVYYNDRPDPNQDLGSTSYAALDAMMRLGVCTTALWTDNLGNTAEEVEAHIKAKPPDAAYADALTRKLVSFTSVPRDVNVFMDTLALGYPISIGVGSHVWFLLDYRHGDTDNPQFIGINSHLNQGSTAPVTIGILWSDIQAVGFEFWAFHTLNLGSDGVQMAIDDCKTKSAKVDADAQALTAPIAQATKDAGVADAQAALSSWQALPVGAQLPPTVTVLTASPNPTTVGSTVALAATVTGSANPTGTVAFRDGQNLLGPSVTLSAGVAVLSIATLAQGAHTLTASYSGDAANAPSSGSLSLAVNAAGGGGGDWTITAPGQTQTDTQGHVWSMSGAGPFYQLLRDSVSTGGTGKLLKQVSGKIYTEADHWYRWTGSTWVDSPAP